MSEATGPRLVILSERHFPVDAATLYRAFADPALLSRWWGPHGFTNRIGAFDLRPGGLWEVTMTSSSGEDFHNRWTFLSVEPERHIVARHEEPVHVFTLHMTFQPAGGGTRFVWEMHFDDTPENRRLERFLAAANQQNFDRLGDLLAITDKGE